MPAFTQVTDPTLQSVLDTASQVREQCAQILAQLQELSATTTTTTTRPTPTEAQDPTTLWTAQRALTARLAQLRGQNRRAVTSVRATKAQTAEARHEVDSLHLQLQNLYYEQRHLRGEIAGCEQYGHKYLQLPMISLDEFLAQHPEHEASDAHELTIARIEDEHSARMKLEEERLRLVRRKEALVKETGQKKDELARLDTEVEKWVGGQEGVRKIFDARERKLAEMAQTRDGEKDGS